MHRQCGLGDERQFARFVDNQVRHVLDRFDQVDAGMPVGAAILAHGALDLRMPLVADQYHLVSGLAVPRNLEVDLGHQRAGGVEHRQTASLGLFADLL